MLEFASVRGLRICHGRLATLQLVIDHEWITLSYQVSHCKKYQDMYLSMSNTYVAIQMNQSISQFQ